MRMRIICAVPAVVAFLLLSGCKTASAAADGVKSAGDAVASGVSSAGGIATSLVNVNLSNVLNDLAVQLHVDRANIPVNAQIPITIAANVCGVSINILSVSGGGGSSSGCTAVTSSPQLAQTVQQQMSATGSVGGGGQTNGTTTTPTTSTTPPTTTTTPPPANGSTPPQ